MLDALDATEDVSYIYITKLESMISSRNSYTSSTAELTGPYASVVSQVYPNATSIVESVSKYECLKK